MSSKFCFVFLLFFCSGVHSASILESSYDYILNLGKSLAPNFLSMIECVGKEEPWGCAREKAGKMLDGWGQEVEKERRMWEDEADAEVRSSGRSFEEMPSKVGREITESFNSLANILGNGMARALERKHDHGGIDTITISTGTDKKKMKKKKQKPPKIHLIHPMVVPLRKAHKEEKGRHFGNGVQSWVIGEKSLPEVTPATVDDRGKGSDGSEESEGSETVPAVIGRGEKGGIVSDFWSMGQNALDVLAEHVVENENMENGIQEKSSFAEQRGKKKKKKKAILKLLVLGAVIKAKIATLLQILTYKLQIKFFIVAVLSLAVNAARLWLDLKNKKDETKTEPQKEWRRQTVMDRQDGYRPNKDIIYYEHAQHQHHYDHEEEEPHGWAPWSRSIFPTDETETEITDDASPYRAQERAPVIYNRPYLTRV